MMVAKGKTFRHKESQESETTHLCTPYRIVVLMLNRIFGRADRRFFKFGWIPLIYQVTMMGKIVNWDDIVTNSLSSCITVAQEGMHERKYKFYLGSFLVDCILFFHPFEKISCKWKEANPLFMQHIRYCGLTNTTVITR